MGFAARITMLSAGPVLALCLGACALPDADSWRPPDASAMFRPMSVTNYKDRTLPPVTAADLVDANGSCAGTVAGGEDVPMIPAAVALEMSECDVVKRAGIAEKVEIGTTERRERTVTLTYFKGQRPGIYHFTAGRLAAMELAPEPASAKPAKKPAKPARRAAQPNQVSVQ